MPVTCRRAFRRLPGRRPSRTRCPDPRPQPCAPHPQADGGPDACRCPGSGGACGAACAAGPSVNAPCRTRSAGAGMGVPLWMFPGWYGGSIGPDTQAMAANPMRSCTVAYGEPAFPMKPGRCRAGSIRLVHRQSPPTSGKYRAVAGTGIAGDEFRCGGGVVLDADANADCNIRARYHVGETTLGLSLEAVNVRLAPRAGKRRGLLPPGSGCGDVQARSCPWSANCPPPPGLRIEEQARKTRGCDT